ncbi:YraN family protein [Shimia marina]|uniref:UPF0102 protein SHM7688_03799 n=1 Tax=Shimia marina TaxID=321267 RepID=A0A0P1FDW5_9RHOB|nr:YraN family protein [Shimia marina]CUH54329.1 hypothetical protein SHM7688_03799 [Shimia marina]SFE00699.1 putative endonuclease [Shimia marina]
MRKPGKRAQGQGNYHAGLAAEEIVLRHYMAQGLTLAAQRWRGHAGEIDLILHADDGFVFVEVKKSQSFATAAARLLPRQVARLQAAAQEYVADAPLGLLTPMRFDVALVNGQGVVHILENALWE